MTNPLIRIAPALIVCAGLSPVCAAPAWADTAMLAEADDAMPGRLTLLEDMDAQGRGADESDGTAWRLPARLVDLPATDEEDVRLRVKLRPNRAMGRVSLSF